jgi:UDP-N-acetylglucosamine transferase subunit ALG13
VIFATVGSHPTYKFERLLRALESIGGELVVQYGPGEPPRNASVAVPWMSFEEIVGNIERADCVVSHAGVGTILCAIQAGQVPAVFPRLKRFNETVDDHQRDLAKRLAKTGKVVVVEDGDALAAALAKAPPRGTVEDDSGTALVDAVRAELHQASAE